MRGYTLNSEALFFELCGVILNAGGGSMRRAEAIVLLGRDTASELNRSWFKLSL